MSVRQGGPSIETGERYCEPKGRTVSCSIHGKPPLFFSPNSLPLARAATATAFRDAPRDEASPANDPLECVPDTILTPVQIVKIQVPIVSPHLAEPKALKALVRQVWVEPRR
ncbi:hypothetical protein HYQ46_009405 [Verticillium longisporum]|nr:hypothetical protein HYQ46_009405 [Verticillium longisporum]